MQASPKRKMEEHRAAVKHRMVDKLWRNGTLIYLHGLQAEEMNGQIAEMKDQAADSENRIRIELLMSGKVIDVPRRSVTFLFEALLGEEPCVVVRSYASYPSTHIIYTLKKARFDLRTMGKRFLRHSSQTLKNSFGETTEVATW